MNTDYFRYTLPATGKNTAKLSESGRRKSVSVDRFGYMSRLIAGFDDDFLRSAGATFSQMAAHRRFRHAIYRRSLSCFQRDYRILEARALAGMQEHGVSIDEIVTSRWKMKIEMAKLEWAGILYLCGVPAGDRVSQVLRDLGNSLRIPVAVS